MLNWLLCTLMGHRFVSKAYTGETMPHHDRLLNQVIQAPFYRWQRNQFCTRCGKPSPWPSDGAIDRTAKP